jgi:hypothetical protein
VKEIKYQLIVGQLYKLGEEEILRRSIFKHEKDEIMGDAHKGN